MLGTVLFAIVGLSTERVAAEVIAILVLSILVLSGVLDTERALRGFSNPALITIAGLMVLTGGLIHNGAADRISRAIGRVAGRREARVLPLLVGAVAGLSAFINNTAATAMFVPVAEGISRRSGRSVSRYLMPVAFASMLGGCLTLVGTSTNLAVSGALQQRGMAPFSMFELTPVGLAITFIGLAYVCVVPFPDRAPLTNRSEPYGIRKYLFELRISTGSPFAGRTLARCEFLRAHELTVVAIVREQERVLTPSAQDRLEEGDVLLVEGDLRSMVALRAIAGIETHSGEALTEKDLTSDEVRLVEATISYNSPLIGWTLKGVGFRQRYGLNVLAIHRRGEAVVEKVGRVRLKAGDALLLQGSDETFRRLAQEPPALLFEDVVVPVVDRRAEAISAAIFVVALASSISTNLPGAVVYLLGGALMVLFRTLSVQDVYQYLNMRLVVLVASMFALGEAMEVSGAAKMMADAALALVGPDRPTLLLLALCVVTVLLTQPMNNAAAALLVLPIAVRVAEITGINPRPLAVGITVAASCSFITPFEPSCILIWDTGKYRFFDFVRMGLPLTLMALAAITLTVPRIWPF